MPLDLPPPLWLPSKPAIIRAASRGDIERLAMLPGMFPAGALAARAAPAWATLDGAITGAMVVSNAGLTATQNSTGTSIVRSASAKDSGKHSFTITATTNGNAFGLVTPAGTLTTVVVGGTQCIAVYRSNGQIWSNNGGSGKNLTGLANGDILDFRIDLDANLGWIRKNAGNWNGDALANPATGVGGFSCSSFAATTLAPMVAHGANLHAATCNFGQSAITPIAGFASGWSK